MNFLSFFMAWKYLRFGKKEKNISFMIRICFLGILIGTFALMLTLIITNGFEKVIHEKIRGISSQAIIYAPGQKLDDTSIKKVLNDEYKDLVKASSSSVIKQVIVDHEKQQSVLFIKGVEPATEGLVSSIEKKIVLPVGHKGLPELLKENSILVGYKTAKQFNLSIGKEIKIMVPEPTGKKKISLRKKKVIVAGIFKVGLDEYDSNFAYCSLNFLKSIFDYKKGSGVDQISLALNTKEKSFFRKNNEEKIVQNLKNRMQGLTVSSWKELYPALVSSLKLEKYAMFFIIALITLVACMNMISLLFMQIQQKRKNIAIFKAMGMPHKQIRRIFLIIGLSITFFGSSLGLGLAAIAGYFLEKYPFIQLPDVYFVSHLPARMDTEIFLAVFFCTILLGFIATWIPTNRTKKINIVDVLRKE